MRLKDNIYNLYCKYFGRYKLVDPRPIQKDSPYTFHIPSIERVSNIEPGDLAKVVFRGTPKGLEFPAERMWVLVKEVHEGVFVGTLDNDPFDIPQLKAGDEIQFNDWHIIDYKWDTPEKEKQFTKEVSQQKWDRCMVDACIIDRNIPVTFLYREEADMTQEEDKYPDSGWRIRGDVAQMTDEEYENEKTMYIALGKVLNVDDSWLHLIDEPIGSRFFKNEKTGKFEVDKP